MLVFQKVCTNVPLHPQCEILKSSNWGEMWTPRNPRWSGQFFHGKARVWTPSKAQEASKRAENKHHPLHSGLVDKMANRGSSSLREESSCKWQNVPKVSSFYVKLHCVISIITINKMNTIMWVLALCWALCQKFPLNHSEILMGAGAGWMGPDPDIHCP